MRTCLILILCLTVAFPAYSESTSPNKLKIFEPFIGTWRADFSDGTHDISHYQWILSGKALRITHSISEGAYGGEALVHWNSEKSSITFRYVTTANFYTEGRITATEDGFEAHEIVHGNMGGITETRAGYTINDGNMRVWSQFLKDGEWTERKSSTYVKAPAAEVRFHRPE